MSYLKDHLKSIGIIILILVSIIIIILPFYIYSKQFGEFDLSKDQEVFGVFGDYFGGVFNIFNFFATIFLAIIISQFDKNRNKENLDLQKNLFERSLKEIAYKEFKLLEYEFYGLSRAAPNYIINLNTKLNKINLFLETHTHIFKSIEELELIIKFNRSIVEIMKFEENLSPENFIINDLNLHYESLKYLLKETNEKFLTEIKTFSE